jgi:stage V sporulation protein K
MWPFRPTDRTLDDADKTIGLAPVKEEIRRLRAELEAEKRRGLARGGARHLFFIGRAGTGKSHAAQLLGKVYRSLKLLRKGHLVEADRASLVATYIGQTEAKTLGVCRSALDGVLFIDQVGMLADNCKDREEFAGKAVETVGKFMDDNPGRILVILADSRSKVPPLVSQYPDFARRFVTIDFPGYDAGELCAILRDMAKAQHYELPDELEARLSPWIEHKRQQWWHGAREMHFLLSKALDAQGERVARHPEADARRIEMGDIMTVMEMS